MFVIPTANELVTFIKDFTGSTNDAEIKKCIFMAELSMRNIELPALRSDPYATENIGIADNQGRIAIPGDMNKPIVFFRQGNQITTTASATGTSGAYTITLVSTPAQNLSTGMVVSGTGIGAGATITNTGLGSGIVTLSVANASNVTGTITFSTPAGGTTGNGPWLVYDRIGDRDIITQGMLSQLYMQPYNVPQVIRGKFSEVYNKYQFLPLIGEGTAINMYYYKAWALLFSPVQDAIVSTTGTVGSISGTGPWTASITGMVNNAGLSIGDTITATVGTGSIGTGTVTIATLVGSTGVTITATGGSTPIAGTVTNITLTNQVVQTNAVLNTWAEGYVYATLREYYIKRHNAEDAAVYAQKYDNAYNIVEDQNNLGKWSGGHTKLTSVWQPRIYRQYNVR